MLTPASIIEIDHDKGFLSFEIRRRIVEGQVSVLPDPNEGDVNRSFADLSGNLCNRMLRISAAVEEVILDDSNFVDQALVEDVQAGMLVATRESI